MAAEHPEENWSNPSQKMLRLLSSASILILSKAACLSSMQSLKSFLAMLVWLVEQLALTETNTRDNTDTTSLTLLMVMWCDMVWCDVVRYDVV